MLTADDNELVTRVGPGTPMGELMRRYWIPAIRSRELIADGEPVRLMLLGEKLIAFRDTNGKIGILDHECPHRLASLFYGRNEEGGLRCIYHGWKFDVEGNCLDMANVPPHQDFKANVKANAYQAFERGGLVWCYMGQGDAPELPEISATLLPEDDVAFNIYQRDCNWLQSLEGDIDTSHAAFLHSGKASVEDYPAGDIRRFGIMHRSPEYEVSDAPWGTMYGAKRPADEGQTYWRLAQFVFPFWTITPTDPFEKRVGWRAWVPMDDHHVMSIGIRKKAKGPVFIAPAATGLRAGNGMDYLPNTTDWHGRWRLTMNTGNDHQIDREMQRNFNYSGVLGINEQDQMVTESMGPVANRTKEHLAPSDRMIMMTRRRLIDAAKALRDQKIAPPASTQPGMYAQIQGGYFVAPKDKNLQEVYQDRFDAYLANKSTLLAAE